IVVGNWSLGSFLSRLNRGRESSTNYILWNGEEDFVMEELLGEPGETLTILVSDINGDSIPDMIVGNDFQVPDFYYIGLGNGEMEIVDRSSDLIERSTLLTMSASAADIDNDLRQEIYLANASGTDRSDMLPIKDICQEASGTVYYDECLSVRKDQALMHITLRRGDPFTCSELSTPELKEQCIGMQLYIDSWWKMSSATCARLEGRFDELADICTEYFGFEDVPIGDAFKGMVPQGARRTNVLLVPTDDNKFVDSALGFNVREAGWSWNAQFADLDQDGWQDLYVANGMFFENTAEARESNHFFKNDGGKNFIDETQDFGLSMNAEVSAYTYVDFDNDGDLDIVAVEAVGPVWAFVNNENNRNAVSFELRDELGNHFGIGTQLVVRLDDGKEYMRELRSSGGFISFNDPIVHFGIGDSKSIDRVEVRWPTGSTSVLEGKFVPGSRYRISRQ
ncbi:MAG: CRTAC1 family protein, partial [Gammaproteobacteria bacterium]|nr:CRTAC1 family protein [Gammaproteobacteria bacterium]